MGRLTVGGSECVFSAKMLAPCSLWMSGRAKGKNAESVEINRRLDELRASALAIYREQSAIRERVTAEEVKCLLLGMAYSQETLLDYFQTYIEHFEKRVGVNRTVKSARTYRCARKHVPARSGEPLEEPPGKPHQTARGDQLRKIVERTLPADILGLIDSQPARITPPHIYPLSNRFSTNKFDLNLPTSHRLYIRQSKSPCTVLSVDARVEYAA